MNNRIRATLLMTAITLVLPISINAQSTPAGTVRAFYKWYVHSLNRNVPEPLRSDKVTSRKYVTGSLLRRIEKAMKAEGGIGADYFLSAQDFDKSWENNIVIRKVSTTASTSTINVVLPSKQMGDQKLKIALKKEGGVWKIDKVNDLNL
jgi:hypothetical protein